MEYLVSDSTIIYIGISSFVVTLCWVGKWWEVGMFDDGGVGYVKGERRHAMRHYDVICGQVLMWSVKEDGYYQFRHNYYIVMC